MREWFRPWFKVVPRWFHLAPTREIDDLLYVFLTFMTLCPRWFRSAQGGSEMVQILGIYVLHRTSLQLESGSGHGSGWFRDGSIRP